MAWMTPLLAVLSARVTGAFLFTTNTPTSMRFITTIRTLMKSETDKKGKRILPLAKLISNLAPCAVLSDVPFSNPAL